MGRRSWGGPFFCLLERCGAIAAAKIAAFGSSYTDYL
jgi:hypothetical protein